MKRITITLTEEQVLQVVKSLEWGKYDYSQSSMQITEEEKAHNAFIDRIIKKFVDASRLVR